MVVSGGICDPFITSLTISVDDSTICQYQDVTLDVVEELPAEVTLNWDFGSGAIPPTAIGEGPHTIQYTTSGSKTVTLDVIYQSQTVTDTQTITVSSCNGNLTGSVKDTFGVGISGANVRLYADDNFDGVEDDATIIKNVFTTSLGVYSMASLPQRSYVIRSVVPSGYTIVSGIDNTEDSDMVPNVPTTDIYLPVTIGPSELDTSNDFVYTTLPGNINGYVFVDDNSNSVPDTGEGVAGVLVELYEDANQDGVSDGVLIDSTVTNVDGYYEFLNVATNTYTGRKRHCVIVMTVPEGYNLVSGIDVSNDGDTVTNTPTTDNVIPVSVTPNETDTNNNFILELIP